MLVEEVLVEEDQPTTSPRRPNTSQVERRSSIGRNIRAAVIGLPKQLSEAGYKSFLTPLLLRAEGAVRGDDVRGPTYKPGMIKSHPKEPIAKSNVETTGMTDLIDLIGWSSSQSGEEEDMQEYLRTQT